jgi:6,7-dimethyl-8-ribityllumazine synthase
MRIGIVVSRFNEVITAGLLRAARECLLERGVPEADIEVAWVPGAWEIPIALERLERLRAPDGMIALGAVIRGGTPHFEYVCRGVADGVASVAAAAELPIAFGVLTTDTLEQAAERSGRDDANKGREAALAVLEMVSLFALLDGADDSEGS